MAKKKADNEDPIEFTPAPELEAVAEAAGEAPVVEAASEPVPLPEGAMEGVLASDFVDPEGYCVVRDAGGTKYRVKRANTQDLGDKRVRFVPE